MLCHKLTPNRIVYRAIKVKQYKFAVKRGSVRCVSFRAIAPIADELQTR